MSFNTLDKVNFDIKQSNLPSSDTILTKDALDFVIMLESEFGERRKELLSKRQKNQKHEIKQERKQRCAIFNRRPCICLEGQ